MQAGQKKPRSVLRVLPAAWRRYWNRAPRGAADASDPLRSPLVRSTPGSEPDLLTPQATKGHRGSKVIASIKGTFKRVQAKLQLRKPVACSSTQTDVPQPPLHYQEKNLFQLEEKQADIDSKAAAIAQLQCEVEALQAELQQCMRKEAATRLWALRVERRGLAHDEAEARGNVELEMNQQWEELSTAFHEPWELLMDSVGAEPDQLQGTGACACVVLPSTAAAQFTFPEPTSPRSPTFARECLFIDRICHWVAAFVRRDWARTCSTSAYAVFKVMYQVHDIWLSAAMPLGQFQSCGTDHPDDEEFFGPELGAVLAARKEIVDLRNSMIDMDTPNWKLRNLLALHMQLTAHMYDEMRLRHRQVYLQVAYMVADLNAVLRTLDDTLLKADARLAAAAEESTDDD